ncbi:MAG: serine/threonine protein kinase [Pseudomonadota bacterium]
MQVISRIGQGGFGNVDRVIDPNTGSEYARKEFSQNQPMPPRLLNNVKKRFAKEVKVQSAIDHPNIVPVVSSDLSVDPPYYLMPLAESSLDKDLACDSTLDGSFVSALSDIVAALEEIHSMEIYHRDLKPQNVLQFLQGDKKVYAVSDFGLISMKESSLSELTQTGMGKGSDYYTAPEIHADLRKASPRSDVYSLGCILHDMVGQEPRIPFREIKEHGSFSAILSGCTKDDPSKRFPTAKSVLDAVLTVEFEPHSTVSAASEDFVEALTASSSPDLEFWERLADYLEVGAKEADVYAIFGRLTAYRIKELCSSDPDSAKRVGMKFSDWVASTAFDFDLCDAIANRIEEFYESADLELKVECLMAFLEMGTSHNRWYVERKFARLCGPRMDENLAKRLVIKFHMEGGSSVCASISHLEKSIGFSRNNLHVRLKNALLDMC